jgi:ABC-type dipeptide/oligopeptide/nickel transport system ATPase component
MKSGRLLTNKHIEDLNEKNDFFRSLDKVNFIKTFIINYSKHLKKDNMLVLYGEWGSGKSTVTKAIEKGLNESELKKKYRTFYFNAWKYEKDKNLAFSLFEFLIDEIESMNEYKKYFLNKKKDNVLKSGHDLLVGSLKGINIGFPFLSWNAGSLIKHLEGIEKETKLKKSLYKKINEFEQEFESILEYVEEKIWIIFIDDLDRCEAENVLNLLSAIKLFFTLGKGKVIYFCGVDKSAVSEAVKVKYGEIIKSEEYLEKIFDISFNMSKDFQIVKLLNHYFPNEEQDFTDKIEKFFKEVKFKNPRHLKKVLNKYTIINEFKKDNPENELTKLIPNIRINGKGYFLSTIFVLYIIILFEFYHEKFEEIKNYDGKFANYSQFLVSNDGNQEWTLDNKINIVKGKCGKGNYKTITKFSPMRAIFSSKLEDEMVPDLLFRLLNLFTPKTNRNITLKTSLHEQEHKLQDILDYLEQFESKENSFPIDFCKYLFFNREEIKEEINNDEWEKDSENYDVFDLFKMAETIL